MGNEKIAVLNVEGRVQSGVVKLQVANDVGLLWHCLKTYFERAVLSDSDIINGNNALKLQSALNARAIDIPELGIVDKDNLPLYSFEANQRVIDLAAMVAIYETTRRIGHSPDHIVRPGWQTANQFANMKNHTGEESWDGFIFSQHKDGSSMLASVPFELKSLMTNPNEPTIGNPNDQLANKIEDFRSSFQTEGSICAVLVMPYSDQSSLAIDLAQVASDMVPVLGEKTQGVACILSFPTDESGRLSMSLLCTIIPKDIRKMSIDNVKKHMHEVNFGKVLSLNDEVLIAP